MIILLLPKILWAQDITIKEPQVSINKKYSIFIGIGKSNQIASQKGNITSTSSQSDNISYLIGVSRKVSIINRFTLNNEASYVTIPYTASILTTQGTSIGNIIDNFNYIGVAVVPEYQLSDNTIIGAGPSLNYHLPVSDFSSYFYPTWRTLSVGGNSYIGITFNDVIVKFRYNINTIDSKKTSTFFGLNIEYRFDL